jgi:hypothetical protein
VVVKVKVTQALKKLDAFLGAVPEKAAAYQQRRRQARVDKMIAAAIRAQGWYVSPGAEVDHYVVERFSDEERGEWLDGGRFSR